MAMWCQKKNNNKPPGHGGPCLWEGAQLSARTGALFLLLHVADVLTARLGTCAHRIIPHGYICLLYAHINYANSLVNFNVILPPGLYPSARI